MFGTLKRDIRAIFERDPAAKNRMEILERRVTELLDERIEERDVDKTA